MAPSERAQPLVGIALKIAATLAFTVMATLVKLASATYPVGELMFCRSFFALVPVLIWAGSRGRERSPPASTWRSSATATSSTW